MIREKQGHARRGAMEAAFRRKASMKDGEKLVQCESESSGERRDKRKEKIVTGGCPMSMVGVLPYLAVGEYPEAHPIHPSGCVI